MEGENKARDQIIKNWSTWRLPTGRLYSDRVYLPSYVEWLTCFEMNKVVRDARSQQGRTMKASQSDGSMTLPAVSSLGINMSGYGGGYRGYRY
jgi:hypothetical protein